jgi:hypothetical protein
MNYNKEEFERRLCIALADRNHARECMHKRRDQKDSAEYVKLDREELRLTLDIDYYQLSLKHGKCANFECMCGEVYEEYEDLVFHIKNSLCEFS